LPVSLHSLIPKIGDDETSILMHNDAVVQGLSELPHMVDVERWGVLTIGTGLGNARFTKSQAHGRLRSIPLGMGLRIGTKPRIPGPFRKFHPAGLAARKISAPSYVRSRSDRLLDDPGGNRPRCS